MVNGNSAGLVGSASLHPPRAMDSRLRGNLLDCGARAIPGDCHGAFGASQRQLKTTERRLQATQSGGSRQIKGTICGL